MIIFWCTFLLLEFVFSKNVEIIEDNPPKIIPVNKSFVSVDYQNSVVIKNFSLINKIQLKVKNIGTTNFYVLASATRDGYSIFENVIDQQKLTEGDLLAGMDPCEMYSVVILSFYSDAQVTDYTKYAFDYQPYKIASEHADDWICARLESVILTNYNFCGFRRTYEEGHNI